MVCGLDGTIAADRDADTALHGMDDPDGGNGYVMTPDEMTRERVLMQMAGHGVSKMGVIDDYMQDNTAYGDDHTRAIRQKMAGYRDVIAFKTGNIP